MPTNQSDRYSVLFSTKSAKSLQKLPKATQIKIAKRILTLTYPFQVNQPKALIKNKTAMYRLRVGDYRVLYDVYPTDKVVLIIMVGHRKDMYR